MEYPPLRIAMLSTLGADGEHPFLVSGETRSWLRSQRPEPLAVCFSFEEGAPPLDPLLTEVERTFRQSNRYSVTASLSHALLAAHSHLAHYNQLSLAENRRYAAATIAAIRPNGVYVARMGPSCVVALRGRQLVSRSNDAIGRSAPEAIQMGNPTPPPAGTEFYPLEEGHSLLLLPGRAGAEATERALAAALDGLPHLVLADGLLQRASIETSAFVIWNPGGEDSLGESGRWWVWTTATPVEETPDHAKPRPEKPRPQKLLPEKVDYEREMPGVVADSPVRTRWEVSPAAPRFASTIDRLRSLPARIPRPRGLPPLRSAGWLLPLLPLGVILAVAILLLRAGLPTPGGANQIITDAGRIMQEAQANPDRDVASSLLDDAISMLEPLAPGNEGARALLADARRSQDRVLDIVRVARPNRITLPSNPEFRPAGLWRTSDSLLILDLGGQLLYRTSLTGDQVEVALRPGEIVEGQPMGRPVTAAWSPPRGTTTEGQLIVVDHVRSLATLNNRGSAQRRWWPPDNGGWQRLGPAAASYDDIFLLDTGREEVWRYPARLPGAAGTIVAATSADLPLASVVDMATDGNLYFLLGNGGIVKQAPGAGRLPFDGVVPHRALHAPSAIFAHPDMDHIWVLEPAESRVVELTNQGAYVRQFVFPPDQIRNAVSLNVDGPSQELRILTPQSVILIPLD